MISEDALKLLLSKLDECGIPYMITGSFASNIHGLPRKHALSRGRTGDAQRLLQIDEEAPLKDQKITLLEQRVSKK